MHSLPVFLRLLGRPVILVGTGEAADAKRRLLERAGAVIVGEDAQTALAIVIDDDPAAERLRARGVLVNATDRLDLCDWTLPAIVERDPVLIAVGTGGASAGLAKALRQRLEAMLPDTLGRLATTLYEARGRLRARWPDPADRRRAIDGALTGPLDPFADGAAARVDVWLEGEPSPAEQGRVETILLTSTDPDALTLRAARLLGQADYLYHPVATPTVILDRARADAVRLVGEPDGAVRPGLTVVLQTA